MKPCDPGSRALLTDLYELTMLQGYFLYQRGLEAVFDMFYRKEPFRGGYCVFCGLEPLLRAIVGLRFSDEDLRYLSSLELFRPDFLEYLRNFRFSGDVYAMQEGEIVFPREPLIRVHAPIMEAQLVESLLLNTINFQTLIATKASRIVEAAGGRGVVEFGLRRAHGSDGAISASRASFAGGTASTSNVLAGRLFNIPVQGTMAHSWIMAFDSEFKAMKDFARLYPRNSTLLVDTYDTLNKGMPAAIRVLRALKKTGVKKFGIRLDSGDLEYLSFRCRALLDGAGLTEATIVVTNELDEYIIEELVNKKAPIDYFGVGTRLVTAYDDPALTGIYKMVAKKSAGVFVPSIKISNTPDKTTIPGIKNVMRIYDRNGQMSADLIFLERERRALGEAAAQRKALRLFHPDFAYESVTLRGYGMARVLLDKVVDHGELTGPVTELHRVRRTTLANLATLHPTYKRLLNPHIYKVSLTRKLIDMKQKLIQAS